MNYLYIARYVIPLIIIIIVVILNFYYNKYELISINTDYITISRLFMSEKVIYSEQINKMELVELPEDKAKLSIYSEKKIMNFFEIEEDVYIKLVEFAKKKNIDFYLNNKNGLKEKMNE